MKTKQKDELDRFYTKPEAVKRCLKKLKTILPDFDTLVEPSAGDGAFLNELAHPNIKAYDIAPAEGVQGVVKSDWFDVDLTGLGRTCVVGNPPFGQRNQLSIRFIQHALSFSNVDLIGFILPNSWNKPSLQNKTFPTEWKLLYTHRLGKNAFLFEGEDYHVPCSFQVWGKGEQFKSNEDLRWPLKPAIVHEDFEILKDSEGADFFMMGAAPKTMKDVKDVGKNNRGYWIKSNIGVKRLKDNILNVPWDFVGNATASGNVYWISTPELIKEYTEWN